MVGEHLDAATELVGSRIGDEHAGDDGTDAEERGTTRRNPEALEVDIPPFCWPSQALLPRTAKSG